MKSMDFLKFESRTAHRGVQYLNFFNNGYGVSVVQHMFSYGASDGLWELAVLSGDKDGWYLCYDTPITDDVIGYLSEKEVNDLCVMVESLPIRVKNV